LKRVERWHGMMARRGRIEGSMQKEWWVEDESMGDWLDESSQIFGWVGVECCSKEVRVVYGWRIPSGGCFATALKGLDSRCPVVFKVLHN